MTTDELASLEKRRIRHVLDPRINPFREALSLAFVDYFNEVLEDIDSNTAIYNKIQADPRFGDLFREVMFRRVGQFMTSASCR